jgi:hypothetical protein
MELLLLLLLRLLHRLLQMRMMWLPQWLLLLLLLLTRQQLLQGRWCQQGCGHLSHRMHCQYQSCQAGCWIQTSTLC